MGGIFKKVSFSVATSSSNEIGMMFALYVLTNANLGKGDISGAREYAQQAHTLAKKLNDSWFKAFILNNMGSTSSALGEYAEAQEYFQASYAIRKEFNDPGGMAEALNHLSNIAILRQEYKDAEASFRESLMMYRDINDKGGVATALDGLGMVASITGDYHAAGEYFREAAKTAIAIQYLALIISIATHVAELWFLTGQVERCVELLTMVLNHPTCGGETKKNAEGCGASWIPGV